MADMAAKKRVSEKFQAWASALPEAEQATLAEWLGTIAKDDVKGHTATWWKQSNAWADAWWQTW
jgi:hypothetical protein